jgi:predicted dithiol-disulfide oxidoreductase (DUF899 family)
MVANQLVVYHFMLPPDWEDGCPGCSFLADHLDGTLPHLNHHDVTLIAVSRAPPAKIAAYKARMDWKFPWVSSFERRLQLRFRRVVHAGPWRPPARPTISNRSRATIAGELPGMSSFFKDESGQVFHTYSNYGRGGEDLIGHLHDPRPRARWAATSRATWTGCVATTSTRTPPPPRLATPKRFRPSRSPCCAARWDCWLC